MKTLSVVIAGFLVACVTGTGLKLNKLMAPAMVLGANVAPAPVDTSGVATSACTLGGYLMPTDENGIAKVDTFYNSAFACRGAWSMGVAGADTGNNIELGDLIASCNPPANGAWVRSWNGDSYNGAHLYLAPTSGGTGYTVVNDIAGTQEFPVICKIAS
ncbi:C-type lectin domain-containing protein [Plasmodiophora brassicae]